MAPVAQLDPGKGKTHRAYLWAYRSIVLQTGPPNVVFDYQSSRAGRHAPTDSRLPIDNCPQEIVSRYNNLVGRGTLAPSATHEAGSGRAFRTRAVNHFVIHSNLLGNKETDGAIQ